jgi:hypothetical protein
MARNPLGNFAQKRTLPLVHLLVRAKSARGESWQGRPGRQRHDGGPPGPQAQLRAVIIANFHAVIVARGRSEGKGRFSIPKAESVSPSDQRLANPCQTARRLPQLMLPNPHHPPTRRAQGAAHFPVARPISSEFLSPERRVVARRRGVNRAGVPETTVHEHGQPQLGEDEIRPDLQPWT